MLQDGVAMTMVTPEMLPIFQHVDDVLIKKLSVRLAMSTRMTSKGGGDEKRGSKPKKSEVAKATNMICSPSFD